MSRPPESKHPLLPWVIMVFAPLVAFHVGVSVAAFGLAVITALGRWTPGVSYFSLRRLDALIANPLTLTFILSAGIAAAIWAAMIAWRTLQERKDQGNPKDENDG